MKGLRASVYLKFNEPLFFDKSYKDIISKYINDAGIKYFTFSDIVCKYKKVVKEGYYGINEGRFDIVFFYDGDLNSKISNLLKRFIMFPYGTAIINKIEFVEVPLFTAGFCLSPVVCLDNNGISIDYTKYPDIFNFFLRKKLLNKYRKIFGQDLVNNSFIFLFRGQFEKIEIDDNILFKGCFNLFGSKELIYLANITGLGDNNEKGNGMISKDLYFYKK